MSNNNWRTPKILFEFWNYQYKFDLDPCTTKENHLNTPYFFTPEEDGLKQKWFGNVFVNPPYGYETKSNGKRGEYLLEKWVKKARDEIKTNPDVKCIVMLLPATVSTKWFHKYVWDYYKAQPYGSIKDGYYVKITFLPNRVNYLDETGTKKQSPRFDSMIVIFKKVPNEIL